MEWHGLFRGRHQAFWRNSAKISAAVPVASSEETIASSLANSIERIRRTDLLNRLEFARLIVILTKNKEARLALSRSGTSFSRIEQLMISEMS